LNRDLGPLRNTIVVLVEVAVAAVFTQATFAANAVRISQIYGGGGNTGATYSRDYVELFNSSGSPVNIGGWSLQYGSATGTINLGTCPNCLTVIPQGATIPAYGYYLIALAQGTVAAPALPVTPDLDVPQAAANNLSATAGKIGLKTDALAAGTPCSPQSAFVDLMGWGSTANCFETAPTAPPSNSSMAVRNNGGLIDTDNNSTDFAIVSAAVPRNSSSTNTPLVTITASAGANGSISPSGPVSVNYGSDQAFAITPNVGYHVSSVAVDGGSVGPVQSYTFTNVITSHTIEASFATDPPAVGSIELFFDAHLTVRSTSISPGQSGTLYVAADLTGLNGITGAEFSISGWPSTMTATPSYPNAMSIVGNPINGGVNIGYPSCQDGMKVVLCKIDYFASGSVPPTTLSVAQHSSPSNSLFPWPQVLKCDEPVFTRNRVTPGAATINAAGVCSPDIQPPTLMPPPTVTLSQPTETTSCKLFISDVDLGTAIANDDCPGPVVITRSGVPPGNQFATGMTTVTYTAQDAAGNTATATQSVTVLDGTPPIVTAPPDVTVPTGAFSSVCWVVLSDADLGSAIATDCSSVQITRTGVPVGHQFQGGTTTITYTATDAAGNTATATQMVTVLDTAPPHIATRPAPVTAVTADPGTLTVFIADATLGSVTATDNCDTAVQVTRSGVPTGNSFPVGATILTYTATDAAGNSSSVMQTVTVGLGRPSLTLSIWPSRVANTGLVSLNIYSYQNWGRDSRVRFFTAGQTDITGTVMDVVQLPFGWRSFNVTAAFDLLGKSPGPWVLELASPSGLRNYGQITIEESRVGPIVVSVLGSDFIRTDLGRFQRYWFAVTNGGSTDADGELAVILPPEAIWRPVSSSSGNIPQPAAGHSYNEQILTFPRFAVPAFSYVYVPLDIQVSASLLDHSHVPLEARWLNR
jgi:hypothetical protein